MTHGMVGGPHIEPCPKGMSSTEGNIVRGKEPLVPITIGETGVPIVTRTARITSCQFFSDLFFSWLASQSELCSNHFIVYGIEPIDRTRSVSSNVTTHILVFGLILKNLLNWISIVDIQAAHTLMLPGPAVPLSTGTLKSSLSFDVNFLLLILFYLFSISLSLHFILLPFHIYLLILLI